MSDDELQTLIELYLRGEASSSQQVQLVEAMEENDRILNKVYQESLLEHDLHNYFKKTNTEDLMRRVVKACGTPQTRSYKKRIQTQERRRFVRQIVPLAAAALILVCISVILVVQSNASKQLLNIDQTEGPAIYKIVNQSLQPVEAGNIIYAGDRLMVAERSNAVLSYKDGTTLLCEAGTLLEFFEVNGAKIIQVDEGQIHANVAKQKQGASMTLRSRHAEVSVLGTSFDLRVDDESTKVDVVEGLVQCSNKRGEVTTLAKGEGASIDGKGSIAKIKHKPDYDAPYNWSFTLNDIECADWQGVIVEGSEEDVFALRSVVREKNEHHGIVSSQHWYDPRFRIREDSIIRMKMKLEKDGFWHMFLLTQPKAGRMPSANMELQPKLPENYQAGEWVTIEFSLKDTHKEGAGARKTHEYNDYFCYCFFFDSQERDLGITIESFEIFNPNKK